MDDEPLEVFSEVRLPSLVELQNLVVPLATACAFSMLWLVRAVHCGLYPLPSQGVPSLVGVLGALLEGNEEGLWCFLYEGVVPLDGAVDVIEGESDPISSNVRQACECGNITYPKSRVAFYRILQRGLDVIGNMPTAPMTCDGEKDKVLAVSTGREVPLEGELADVRSVLFNIHRKLEKHAQDL